MTENKTEVNIIIPIIRRHHQLRSKLQAIKTKEENYKYPQFNIEKSPQELRRQEIQATAT